MALARPKATAESEREEGEFANGERGSWCRREDARRRALPVDGSHQSG